MGQQILDPAPHSIQVNSTMSDRQNYTSQPAVCQSPTRLFRFAQLACGTAFICPVVLIPLIFSAANTHTIVIKETIAQLSTVIMILCLPLLWYIDRRKDSKRQAFPFPTLLITVLFTLLLYLFYSAHSTAAHHPRAIRELNCWVTYIILAVVSMRYASSSKRFDLYLTATVLVSAVVAGYAVSQRLGYDFFPWDDFKFGEKGIGRASASLGNPDYLAGYLVALIPLTILWAVARRGFFRIVLSGIVLLQLAALIFSYSRGGWVAAFATTILLFASLTYINWIRDPVLLRPMISRQSAIAGLAVMLVLCGILLVSMWTEITATAFRFAQIGEDTSILTRPYFWSGAFRMWASRPLFGFGIGTFLLHFTEFRDTSLSIYLPFKQWNVSHAHNEFLEILAETGLVGMLLYLAVFVLVTKVIWTAMLTRRDRANLTLIGLWAGMSGLFIHNLFTVTLRNTPSAFLLWSFAGVAVGRAVVIAGIDRKQWVWPRWILYGSMLLAIPYLFHFATRTYTGDSLIKTGIRIISELDQNESMAHNRGISERALIALHKSRRLVPDNHESNYLLGLVYFKILDYPQAIEAYKSQVELKQSFTSNRTNIGVSYAKQASLIGTNEFFPRKIKMFPDLARDCLQESVTWFENAHDSDPASPEHLNYMGISLYNLDEFARAEKAFLKAIHLAESRPFESPEKLRDVYYYLGLCRFNLKQWETSKNAFHQSVRLAKTAPFKNYIKLKTIDNHLISIQKHQQQIKTDN